jgi:hypothetical protein
MRKLLWGSLFQLKNLGHVTFSFFNAKKVKKKYQKIVQNRTKTRKRASKQQPMLKEASKI